MTISTLVKKQTLKKAPFCMSTMLVFDAAVQIADLDVNALAVVDRGALVGIITDHDIIRCLAKSGAAFDTQTVADWMSRKVVTCGLETKMSKALNLMAGRSIRHLVVTEDSRPVTVISSKELLTSVHENDELEIRVLQDLARVSHGSIS
jgi:CBS domain-containing protein